MRLSDVGYNDIKRLVTLAFPGLGTGFYLLSLTQDLPAIKALLGVCLILSFLGGVLLSISTKRYEKRELFYDGKMIITIPEEDKKLYTLEFHGNIDDLDTKRALLFKVVSPNLGDEEIT